MKVFYFLSSSGLVASSCLPLTFDLNLDLCQMICAYELHTLPVHLALIGFLPATFQLVISSHKRQDCVSSQPDVSASFSIVDQKVNTPHRRCSP